MTLRGALLGCGHVSIFHLRAWAQIEDVRIIALANRDVSKAEVRAKEFGIPLEHVYSDYRELLDKEAVDFVDIATAPDVHREQVEATAARGRHVLCQKPLALSLEDAQAMLAACETTGVLLSVNENWRWRRWYREVKRLLQEGVIGRPRYACITHHSNRTLPQPDGSLPSLFANQPYTRDMDRLIVYEWGIHLIDILRFLFGGIRRIYARMDRASPLCKGEDRAVLTLDFGDATGLIDISWASTGPEVLPTLLERVTIEGDEGTLELLPGQGDLLRVTAKSQVWEQPAYTVSREEAYQDSYTAAQRHFVQCLRLGVEPETSARDNLLTLAATFGAYDSAASGQVIHL